MTTKQKHDIESFIEHNESDISLRCINWCVDVYVYTDQLSKAMRAKWSRANHLLGVE